MLQQGSELQKRLTGNARSYLRNDRNPAVSHDIEALCWLNGGGCLSLQPCEVWHPVAGPKPDIEALFAF